MSNADNPIKGAEFQEQVRIWFEKEYNKRFISEKKIAIGYDAEHLKDHKFDIVDEDDTIAIECKRYTWTAGGNVPSAKIGFTNEAAFYLSFLERFKERYIVMLYSYNEKRKETLAEYYYRTNKHLLGDIIVAEFDPECMQNCFKIISNNASKCEGETRYFLIEEATLGKMEDAPNGACYIYLDGEWIHDIENEIRDRLIGYDPYGDPGYGIGNTSIMREITEITKEEAAGFISKR